MTSLLYADLGGNFDDRAILLQYVTFCTAQRAYAANLHREAKLEEFGFQMRAFHAIEAYSCKALAVEDFLSWTLALRRWKPGTVIENCLLIQLDKTQLNEQSEKALVDWAQAATPEDLRSAFHIPSRTELLEAGYEAALVDRIDTMAGANLDGLRRTLDIRSRNNRNFVVGFNKIKHLNLAVPREEDNVVLFPRYKGTEVDADGNLTAVEMQMPRVSCEPDNIRRLASEAIVGQVILNSLLMLILTIRYGDVLSPPGWAVKSLDLPGWYEQPDA